MLPLIVILNLLYGSNGFMFAYGAGITGQIMGITSKNGFQNLQQVSLPNNNNN